MKTGWWWLSFSGDGATAFRGACIVQADDGRAAYMATVVLGINPGGEVKACEYPTQEALDGDLLKFEPYRLYTREELIHRDDIVRLVNDEPA